MSDMFKSEKRKKRMLVALSALLAASLTVGFAACGKTPEEPEPDDTPAVPADAQLLKNGNFEFYGSEMVKEFKDKRTLISTPTSWSFSQGNPTSNARSGLVEADEWAQLAKPGRPFTSVQDAYEHFEDEGVTVYDRLKFYNDYKDDIEKLSSSSAEKKLFNEYQYSIKYADVEKLAEDVGETLALHPGVEEGENGVLMIHNDRSDENVLGTAQSYQMSSTYTLGAGTAAKITLWVRTEALYHYEDREKDIPVTYNAGAYISLTGTVGSNSTEMQVKNIVTGEADKENNGWRQYELYIRGNTYATSTFRLKLGLGQGSDNRFEMVNGYAFFDDVVCTILSDEEYEEATALVGETGKTKDGKTVKEVLALNNNLPEETLFDSTKDPFDVYAIDMLENGTEDPLKLGADGTEVSVGLTEEDGWTSEKKGFASDNRTGEADANIGKLTTYDEIKNEATNLYLTNIYKDHFENKFPFPLTGSGNIDDEQVVMLLSANGAAYTATLKNTGVFELKPDSYLLLTFFVKTSEMRSGRSGAGAILVDGETETAISPFDSTTIASVDIDEDRKDIYQGWVQCTFFIANETDEARSFSLKLTYGPTSIASSTASSYGEGWAAFAGFSTRELSKSEYNYVAKNDRAKAVSLTDSATSSTKFDDAGKVRDIEKELAHPVSFTPLTADSRAIDPEGKDVTLADLEGQGIYSGLLSSEYAKNYMDASADWKTNFDKVLSPEGSTADEWWESVFGDTNGTVARQPLVMYNAGESAAASVGYYYKSGETLSADSYRRVSMRVKLSTDMDAYFYLTDISDVKNGYNDRLTPAVPTVTYWYDDDGNLCGSDPAAEDYDETDATKGILYEIQSNGLYTKKGATDGKYYANLSNYEVNDKGNLATTKGEEVFYGKQVGEGDAATYEYYAYYDETKTGDARYSTRVYNFPEGTPVRYTAPASYENYETVIKVSGSEANGEWVTVSFFLHSGNTEKKFRIEAWAGARDNKADGFKANGYVFLDQYVSKDVSSTYADYLNLAKEALEEDDANVVDPEAEEKHLKDALYYTFTFFDSPDYVRYDETLDEEKLGNHWASYKQSEQEESIVYLTYSDMSGALPDGPASYYFVDYAAAEKTVTPDDLGGTDSSDSSTDSEPAEFDWGNLLLILSSVLLALVLLAVIAILIARKVIEHLRKTGKIKPKEEKKKAPKKEKKAKKEAPAPAPEEQEEETPAPEKKEDDFYNE